MANIQIVTLVGAGPMGCGIAQVFALAGFEVRLYDRDQACLQTAKNRIEGSLKRQAAKQYIASNIIDETLARIQILSSLNRLKSCDLLLEAISENEEEKRHFWETHTPRLRPETLLASTTSAISITRLAAASGRAGKFIGLHFMNPPQTIELVEIVRGIATDQETLAVCRDLITKIGKTAIISEDFPAFIVNRITLAMVNEAIYTLYEGVGSVRAIDSAIRLGTRHPVGPLELADFIGLDTCLHTLQVLREELADDKYRPCPLLLKYVEAGWLGRKRKRGFYDYSGPEPVPTR